HRALRHVGAHLDRAAPGLPRAVPAIRAGPAGLHDAPPLQRLQVIARRARGQPCERGTFGRCELVAGEQRLDDRQPRRVRERADRPGVRQYDLVVLLLLRHTWILALDDEMLSKYYLVNA